MAPEVGLEPTTKRPQAQCVPSRRARGRTRRGVPPLPTARLADTGAEGRETAEAQAQA